MRGSLAVYGLLTGGIVGVGIFGLPAAAVTGGILPFVSQALLALLLSLSVHLLYAEIVLAVKGSHRLPGYAGAVLGPRWKTVALVANLFGMLGAMLAYLLVGGELLHLLLGQLLPLTQTQWVLVYFALGGALVLRGVRQVATAELLIVAAFFVSMALLAAASFDTWSADRLALPSYRSLLPYGVLLFSFWGVSMVPAVTEHAGRRRGPALRIIIASMLTAAFLYACFTVLVLGVTGGDTTPEALEGMRSAIGARAVLPGIAFGFLATFSSFIALGVVMAETYQLDFRMPRSVALPLALLPPLVLFLLGVQEFLTVLQISGAVFLGLEGMIVLRIAERLRGRGKIPATRALIALCGALFLLGVGLSLADVAGLL